MGVASIPRFRVALASVTGSTLAKEVPVASALLLVNEILFCPPHYFVLQISKAGKGDKIMIEQKDKSMRPPKEISVPLF